MTILQHFVISWVLSNLNFSNRRDRIVATICGVMPDIDVAGQIIDIIKGDKLYTYFFALHHKLGHNVLFLVIIAFSAYFICQKRIWPTIISILTFLLHIIIDLICSGGPESSIWPIWPFWPFNQYELSISWQWELSDWKNVVIAAVFIITMFIIAAKKKRTFLKVFSTRLDNFFIDTIQDIIKRDIPC